MKRILKLTIGLIVGASIGFLGAYFGVHLASGAPIATFGERLAEVNALQITGVVGMLLVFMLLSFFLHVILHEGGHLLCGLATGYRFVSFRILNLTLIKQKGKLRIKSFSIAGTGGQCLLTPPDKPLDEIPCTLYNLGGVLANLLTAGIAITWLLAIDDLSYPLKMFLAFFAFIGIVIGLMNGIPLKIGGIGNDADNMRLLRKDKKSKQALMLQLRANALVQEGTRPRELPEEWFVQEDDMDYKNALRVTIRLMHIGRLQDREEWDAAYDLLEETMSHKDEIIGLLVKEMECELLFTALVLGKTGRAEELYTPELMEYIEQYKNVTSSKQRIRCALALYREKDAGKAKEIYEAICYRKDKYLMQGEVNSDIALLESILTKEQVL